MKFTDRGVQHLKPGAQRYVAWEEGGGGLGVRVTPTGSKTFVYGYRFAGKARMLTLGRYPAVSLAQAHIAHAQAREQVERNLDPGARAVAERAELRKAPTVAALADEYVEKWAQARKRSWREDRRILDKDVLPHWGTRKAHDILRRDVILLLDGIVERGAPIQANRTLAIIRKMFNFAVGRDIVPANPCAVIRAPAPEHHRDRVLDVNEIKAFWGALDRAEMSAALRLALRLQLVTAQRKGEIIAMEWDEIDSTGSEWTIPLEKSKNKLSHRVPLSPLAREILVQARALAGASRWVFPSPRGEGPVAGPAVDHAMRRNRGVFGLEYFTPHDLRRSAASHMTGMSIPRLVVSKILNHVESGVTAVYDRYSYDPEKRQALDAWARKLQAIIGGAADNVVPFLAPAPKMPR